MRGVLTRGVSYVGGRQRYAVVAGVCPDEPVPLQNSVYELIVLSSGPRPRRPIQIPSPETPNAADAQSRFDSAQELTAAMNCVSPATLGLPYGVLHMKQKIQHRIFHHTADFVVV